MDVNDHFILRVLIIENDPDDLADLRELLDRIIPNEVDICSTAQEAAKLVQDKHHHFCIIDYKLKDSEVGVYRTKHSEDNDAKTMNDVQCMNGMHIANLILNTWRNDGDGLTADFSKAWIFRTSEENEAYLADLHHQIIKKGVGEDHFYYKFDPKLEDTEYFKNLLVKFLPLNPFLQVKLIDTTKSELGQFITLKPCSLGNDLFVDLADLCAMLFVNNQHALTVDLEDWSNLGYSESLCFAVSAISKYGNEKRYFLKVANRDSILQEYKNFYKYIDGQLPTPPMKAQGQALCGCLGGLLFQLDEHSQRFAEIYNNGKFDDDFKVRIRDILVNLYDIICDKLHLEGDITLGVRAKSAISELIPKVDVLDWVQKLSDSSGSMVDAKVFDEDTIVLDLDKFNIQGSNFIRFFFKPLDKNGMELDIIKPGALLGRVHGDLHSANILINMTHNQAFLIDFSETREHMYIFQDYAKLEYSVIADLFPLELKLSSIKNEFINKLLKWQLGLANLVPEPSALDKEVEDLRKASFFICCIRKCLKTTLIEFFKRKPKIVNDDGSLPHEYEQLLIGDYYYALLAENIRALKWSIKKPPEMRIKILLSCIYISDILMKNESSIKIGLADSHKRLAY